MEHRKAELSETVADALDHGFIPWRFPALPRSFLSGKCYGGVNPVLLGCTAARLNFVSPFWASYSQWQLAGCTIRQNDGARIVLYKQMIRSKMEERVATDFVYNWEQTGREHQPVNVVKADPEPAFHAIIKGLGVKLEHGTDTTCKYYGADDRIRLPHKWMFEIGPGGVSGYYDALGHEIFHATERRVKWDSSDDVAELRAEIGTGYLGAALGVKPLPRNLARHHDAHAERWAKQLRTDPNLLFRVCEDVTETLGSLLRYAGREPVWQLNAR